MTFEMLIVLAILFTAVLLFVTELVRVDIVALGVVVSLMVSGVLTTSEALAGFSNSAVVTIAALFVIGGAVMQTGLADLIGRNILHVAGKGERRLPLVLMLVAALMSSFMSDTGTVAVLLPVVVILARNAHQPASKLLLPMAYGSLLGGAMTLIGTPPNIIVNDVLGEAGETTFQFFSYTPLGLLILLGSLLFFWLIGQKMLPQHKMSRDESPQTAQKEVAQAYQLQDDMARLRVRLDSPLVGQTVAEANLRRDYDIDLLEVARPRQPRRELSLLGQRENGRSYPPITLLPEPSTTFQLDDLLVVLGEPQQVADAAIRYNLATLPPQPEDGDALVGGESGIAEVVLPRDSKHIGKTLTESNFHALTRLNVLSLFRPNAGLLDDVRGLRLQFGDVLIVHGTWENVLALKQSPRDYIVLGQPEALIRPPAHQRAAWAALILLVMVVTMVGEWLPLTQTALVAAGLMVLTGCISMDRAYRAIDWKSIMLIAGMIPMSTALAHVGLVDLIANGLVASLGQLGPLVMLAGLFGLTAVFTQFLSNTATVVILAPIALTAAQQLGVTPHAFLMGIAVAGSMAFASPVASPVNTLVMGAGSYRFADYLKAGLPLILLALLLSLLFLPLLFPF